jgi:hypothetical protein
MLGGIAKNGDNEYAHKDIAEAELVRTWLNGADQDLTQPCNRDSGAGEYRRMTTDPTPSPIERGHLSVILLLKGSKTLPRILIAVVGATVAVGVLGSPSVLVSRFSGRFRRACLPSRSRG